MPERRIARSSVPRYDAITRASPRTSAGVPSAITAPNPARIYGFDVDALQPIADRVCPSLKELTGAA